MYENEKRLQTWNCWSKNLVVFGAILPGKLHAIPENMPVKRLRLPHSPSLSSTKLDSLVNVWNNCFAPWRGVSEFVRLETIVLFTNNLWFIKAVLFLLYTFDTDLCIIWRTIFLWTLPLDLLHQYSCWVCMLLHEWTPIAFWQIL